MTINFNKLLSAFLAIAAGVALAVSRYDASIAMWLGAIHFQLYEVTNRKG